MSISTIKKMVKSAMGIKAANAVEKTLKPFSKKTPGDNISKKLGLKNVTKDFVKRRETLMNKDLPKPSKMKKSKETGGMIGKTIKLKYRSKR
tara:strand:+ start:713 stop:988 length:276 start_codon:yes stop_codon:yes gene_type:complete